MGTTTKLLTTLALVGAGAVLGLPTMASAATRSGVTIHPHYGFEGFVFSPKPGICADGRTVNLFKEKGKKPNPKRDVKVDQSTAFKNSADKYRWEARSYGLHPGHFYARAPATPACQADNSKTVHIHARPNTQITGIEERGHGARHRVDIGFKGVGSIPRYTYRTKLDGQPSYQHHRYGEATYRHLSAGDHLFKVFAIASNGKRDRTPAKLRFHIDHHGHVTT
jgi:hypothetical protein